MQLSEIIPSTGQQFPTTKEEDWQFTDISFLKKINWRMPLQPTVSSKLTLDPQHLAIVDGALSQHTWSEDLQIATDTNFVIADSDRTYFTDLNLSQQPHSIVITIPDHYRSHQPLFIDYGVTVEWGLVQPRLVINIGRASEIVLVELFDGQANTYLTNSLLRINLHESAKLQHIRCQKEALTANHIATTIIEQDANSNYRAVMLDLGAKLARHHPIIYSQAEGTNTELLGLAIINQDRLIDTHSSISHLYPHSTSRQLHKAIISDRAQGVFNGRIFVSKRAQQTDSAQLSRTLLLSPQAKINTKPQLEIIADNVKCKHGATVSQLDPEQQFYLESRGISTQMAKTLLTYSFALEVLAGITDPSLYEQMAGQVKNALQSLHTIARG
ncbi:MAG: Fe-S cluster assembly protein SufD [Pseudanabaenaceae cyanobacterium]